MSVRGLPFPLFDEAVPRNRETCSANEPTYTKNGDLLPFANYREWVYLTTGMDMSYAAKAAGMDHSMFDNIFVNPEAYRSFLKTGTWPDKTVMILEAREARSKGSINQAGHFQAGDVMDFEVHVKDESRFPGKWAFFSFDSPNRKRHADSARRHCYPLPRGARCRGHNVCPVLPHFAAHRAEAGYVERGICEGRSGCANSFLMID